MGREVDETGFDDLDSLDDENFAEEQADPLFTDEDESPPEMDDTGLE
jgi:hypothetical protein